MEENSEKETGSFRVAGAVMRLGLLLGSLGELMMMVFILAIPFYLLNLIIYKSLDKIFELSGLFVSIVATVGAFLYIGYLFVSNRIFGRTFPQAGFKSVIVGLDNEKLEPRDITRRILVKIVIALVWFGLGAIIFCFYFL